MKKLKHYQRPEIGNLQASVVGNLNIYQKGYAYSELYALINYVSGLEAEIRELNDEIEDLNERIKIKANKEKCNSCGEMVEMIGVSGFCPLCFC